MKLTNEQYHADREHVSKTWLDKINKSPAHLYEYLYGEPKEKSDEFIFGALLHEMVLEGHHDNYLVGPKEKKNTKKGKAAWAECEAVANGRQIVTFDAFAKAEKMRDAIFKNKHARFLLKIGEPEQTIFYKDDSGVMCKARADWLREHAAIDVKTTIDASPEGFAKAMTNYRYHVQAAHYDKGFDIGQFIYIAAEKDPPYCVAVYRIGKDSFEKGFEDRQRNLETYIECLEKNEWPGYPDEIKTIEVKPWAR